MINNYFKSAGTIHCFNDTSVASAQAAYTAAVLVDSHVVAFRMPRIPGPWENAELVGYRSETAITADLVSAETESLHATDPNRISELQTDLAALYDELAARKIAAGAFFGRAAA